MTTVKEKMRGIREKTAELHACVGELRRENLSAIEKLRIDVREMQKGMAKKVRETEECTKRFIREFYG